MKMTNYWPAILSLAGKGCILFVSALALLPSSGEAQCTQWNVSGEWTARVVNGAEEAWELQQSGNQITGKASFYGGGSEVHGEVKGDDFQIGIYWKDGEPGRNFEYFVGKIGPDGMINGKAATLGDKDHWTPKKPWSSGRAMKCTSSSAPTAPRSKPITKLKITPTTPEPTPAAHASGVAAPIIGASPNEVTVPAGQTQGTTLLSWDGGKDHPYAEVWVKVDDQDEKFMVESGKGRRQMKVEPGKTYLYILTDSGQRLATVTVKGKQ